MMDSKQYTYEIKQFMLQYNEHSNDFKSLVLRLMALYSGNVKLVSAITHVPETLILKWRSEWSSVNQPVQIDFVSDGSGS
jgi:hypothetical protein